MSIHRSFNFITDDPHWVRKLAIAWVLNLLPTALWATGVLGRHAEALAGITVLGASPIWYVVLLLAGAPLLGFGLRVMLNVIAGHDVPLPEWSGFSGILRDGLLLWGVVTIWSLPNTVLNMLSRDSSDGGGVLQLLLLVVGLVTVLVQPAAEARLAATGVFREGLNVATAMRRVGARLGTYLKLLLVSGGILVLIPVLFADIGWAATGAVADLRTRIQLSLELGILLEMLLLRPYLNMVFYHLAGQVYAQTENRGTIT